MNPQETRGSSTGVFVGVGLPEAHEAWSSKPEEVLGYTMTGCHRSMMANRLSFFFNFKGCLTYNTLSNMANSIYNNDFNCKVDHVP